MVFLRKEDQWLVVHEHFSSFPDESERNQKSSKLGELKTAKS
jgi:hypothetical protein